MKEQKIVIALGGNAIQAGDGSAQAQQKAIEKTVSQLVKIIKLGYQAVITHGNGPQVGNILLQQIKAHSKQTPAMPLDTCGAMSQGMIGYWLEKQMNTQLRKEGISKEVAAIVTQVEVDPKDPAFNNPTKPIGPFYSEEEVKKIMEEDDEIIFKEDAGRGWRRVVVSPKPINILEYKSIKTLIQNDYIVIAAGGGGIPVYRHNDRIIGVEGVIDKDFASEKLAELIDADILLILTEVENVYIHFNKPEQKALKEISFREAEKYMKQGQFAQGSMLPKVEAAVNFVKSKPGRKGVITSLDKALDAILGKTGTVIKTE
ncbi:carbamate kinase [Garciella nitratireducens]|uniref:Carbamate kinase n=1 Tax=Garciella nitratireducens DSM 15102 TaxID=1121911 RepID=A0A1T4MH47_9FIRM|nr:carbamate kinase [Garciella nitratireducens]SJZ66272.1 carbamate kinase [Garciella nitratireducens DSM 15102]